MKSSRKRVREVNPETGKPKQPSPSPPSPPPIEGPTPQMPDLVPLSTSTAFTPSASNSSIASRLSSKFSGGVAQVLNSSAVFDVKEPFRDHGVAKMSGSSFVIMQTGNVVILMTNAHVVEDALHYPPPPPSPRLRPFSTYPSPSPSLLEPGLRDLEPPSLPDSYKRHPETDGD